jgi:predicted ferric reductase
MRFGVLVTLLGSALVTPLLLGWWFVGPARPWRDELAAALALLATSGLLLTFVLSGRLRAVSGRIGIDRTLRWHQVLAWVLLAALLVHPWLYTTPSGAAFHRPDDLTNAGTLGIAADSLVTGWLALLGLALLAVTGRGRDQLPYRYEAWRLAHGVGASLVAGLAVHHTLEAGRYAAHPVVAASILALLALALGTVLYVRLVKPFLLRRRPWRVASVGRVAERMWQVVLEPVGHAGLAFNAGQFAWLRLDRGPFNITEHPFTIASAPDQQGRLGFLIRQAGDFTSTVCALPPGAPAYVDGPYGTLTLQGRNAPGVVFLCGGAGIAPAMAMLRDAARHKETAPPMLLLYGNQNQAQIGLPAELDALSRTLKLEVVHVLAEPPPGWTGEVGVLDEALLRRRCAKAVQDGWLFVVCGSSGMLRVVNRTLRAMGVAEERILAERFSYD